MNRETGLFLEEFHKSVIPTTDEQARYSSRREVRQILELLERLPKNAGNGALTGEAMRGNGGNERVLMPQILDGLRKNEFTFFLQPRYELNTRKVIGAEALVRWNHPVLGVDFARSVHPGTGKQRLYHEAGPVYLGGSVQDHPGVDRRGCPSNAYYGQRDRRLIFWPLMWQNSSREC